MANSGFLCLDRGISTEIFFPENLNETTAAIAKRYCSKCLRWKACLAIAFQFNIDHGIFGGMTPIERSRYLVTEALKEGTAHFLQQKTLREQQHPEYVNLSSQVHILDVRIHIPLVLSTVAVKPLLSPIVLPAFV